MADFKTTGGCLCGGVKFEISGAPAQVLNCHCSMCRRAIGASFGTFAAIRFPEGFHYTSQETLKEYESSPGLKRLFCGRCGCSIMDKHTAEPNTVWVTAGTFNGELGRPIDAHIFVGSKAPWVSICDGIPACNEAELWTQDPAKNQ